MGLDYPLTRTYPWKNFTLISYLGALIVVGFLTTVNVALAGYETITVFKSDYNVTQEFWYHNYLPSLRAKPGTLCDTHIFNLGDSFTTNYTLFPYTIVSVSRGNAGDVGVSYKGAALDNCDVVSIYLTGNFGTFSLDYTAIVLCRGADYEFTSRVDFSMSSLVGRYNTLMGAARAVDARKQGTFNDSRDARGALLDVVTGLASNDLGQRTLSLMQAANGTEAYPTIISIQADFPFCPASVGPLATCATSVPTFTIPASFLSLSNLSFSSYFPADPASDTNRPVIDDRLLAPLTNALQGVYAALRIDLGNPSPNNFLLNTTVLNTTLAATFPTIPGIPEAFSVSHEYEVLSGAVVDPQYNITGLLPLPAGGPATIDVVYLCRFQRRLPPARAFIAVLVATLSMFGSAWAVYLGLAAGFAKRGVNSNACAAHVAGAHGKEDSMEKERFLSQVYSRALLGVTRHDLDRPNGAAVSREKHWDL
ncbi:hypothetical protein MKEN_00632300 [Mycena kentingensis (nom. inval.)]|nr:hypothetical protein MKEN_00632300 [Mycena kentingensis (nom. inval.)]